MRQRLEVLHGRESALAHLRHRARRPHVARHSHPRRARLRDKHQDAHDVAAPAAAPAYEDGPPCPRRHLQRAHVYDQGHRGRHLDAFLGFRSLPLRGLRGRCSRDHDHWHRHRQPCLRDVRLHPLRLCGPVHVHLVPLLHRRLQCLRRSPSSLCSARPLWQPHHRGVLARVDARDLRLIQRYDRQLLAEFATRCAVQRRRAAAHS
mmetsp:Transcript_106004/g.304810  ORF Transcript_106004/g.304810 Transcript_106004/m.304810 type:complete len:205 (-) Transcript_106004:522-1136(-)